MGKNVGQNGSLLPDCLVFAGHLSELDVEVAHV
jgi:hypothetical protein